MEKWEDQGLIMDLRSVNDQEEMARAKYDIWNQRGLIGAISEWRPIKGTAKEVEQQRLEFKKRAEELSETARNAGITYLKETIHPNEGEYRIQPAGKVECTRKRRTT